MNYPEQQHTGSSFAGRCYRHPDRETNVSCTRCDRPICPDCLRSAAVGFQCPECVRGQNRGRQATLPYGGRIAEQAGLVSIVLGVLNIGMYILTALTSPSGVHHNASSRIFVRLVLVPEWIARTGEYWRLIGTAFLHYGFLHIAVNMISLAVLGPGVERVFGRVRFAVLYIVAALGGSVAVYAFDPNPLQATAGASAAIFGLFGALIVLYRKLGLDIRALIPTILINAYITYRVPNISWIGHLGGLVTGALVALVLVYAPRVNRLRYQIGGITIILAIMVGLTVWRGTDLGAFSL
jgi:membrane associated rhomboid family serine protease